MYTELRSYFDRGIYTNTGIYVGKVVDLLIDVESQSVTGIVANNINRDVFDISGDGIILPYRWVISAADIVLIRDVIRKFERTDLD